MYRYSIALLAVIVILFGFSARSWGTMQDQIDYDNSHPEWEQIFYPGGPEYRGQWTFGIERYSLDKLVDAGSIASKTETRALYLSGADNRRTNLWSPCGRADSDRLMGGFSFSNDISSWLSPPEGATRSISYVTREDFSGGGYANNSDIISIDENEVEVLLKHGGLMGGLLSDTLGQEDPWDGSDVAISSLDYKADMAPVPQIFSHTVAINEGQGANYYGIPQGIKNQGGEDVYFSSSKTGRFDTAYNLMYGKRINKTWGSQDGSGYSGESDGRAFSPVLDRYGKVSGENIGTGCDLDDVNGRWYGQVEIDAVTYKLYLEEADGSIKAYDPTTYPRHPTDPDPEAASGFPIRWHDDHELEVTYGLDLDVDNYGQAGRWVAERSEYYYMMVRQAHAHTGDVMSETRTYEPKGNADGPMNPHEWLYDGNGDMYVPDYYWDGVNAPEAYTNQWDGDSPYERAFHLIGVKGSWTENDVKLPDPGTPPDGEHDWQSMEDTERREIDLPNGPPDSNWNWTGTTGVLQESHTNAIRPPPIALPDGVIWFMIGPDPDPLNPGNFLWETHDEVIPANPVDVTDWRAPEYNWRTFVGYTGVDQHPAYPNDDHSNKPGKTWKEWVYDAGTETWSFYTCGPDMDDAAGNYDLFPTLNLNNGVVSQQYFEYAWKIAGALLGDRFWEENPDYFWSNNLGAVATREYFDDQLVRVSNLEFNKPVMYWDTISETWEFPDTYNAYNGPIWGFMDTFEDTPVAGHEALNNFMRYVMDIDALVIQDTNENGIYDEGDYILFSLVDDSLFTKMMNWGKNTEDCICPTTFAGQYFNGETIFLYHGGEVTTYFDPTAGIFFGESISTVAIPYESTLWSMMGMYDINALDIGLTGGPSPVPEPSTLILLIGGAVAMAGLIRRKIRK